MDENKEISGNEKPDQINPEEFKRIFDTAEESAEKLHTSIVESAQYAGLILQVIKVSRRVYMVLARRSLEEPKFLPLVVGGMEIISYLTKNLEEIFNQYEKPKIYLRASADTASTFLYSSGTSTQFEKTLQDEISPYLPEILLNRDRDSYAKRLETIDMSLGKTYKEAWESYYGTKSDPLRSALFLMRQTFDHFFNTLAPDDKVRASQYWGPKKGDEPYQIHRVERIEYSAFTYIKEKSLAVTYAASAKQLNQAYDLLNKAHKRGELDPEKDTNALLTISKSIEDWLDVIDLSNVLDGSGI